MIARRLVVLNFEGVITTNADPYSLFIEKAAKLGIRDGDALRKERLMRPKRNVLPTISRLMDSMCRKSEMELQKISEQFAMDTAVFPGIKTLLETIQHDETIDVLIISDFNNVMLEQTLVAKKIAVGRMDIVTNSLRLLAYGEYEPVLRSRAAANCEYCPPNLCRGMELRTYLREAKQRGIHYSMMVLMASSRSDLCAARLLRQKDFVCTPVDSELAHILTKVSKIERIMGRVLQNSRIRVEMKHMMIYSDPQIVLRILRNGSVDSAELGSGFITVVNEKHARLHGVPLNLLPSSKLKRIQQTEESLDHKNEETEGMLKVSPPFTVGAFVGCSIREESVSARNVDNKMLDPVSDSPRFASWMKCIRNIMDALDHYKNENCGAIQDTLTTREGNSDYFCRRRGPSDMPRGYSTPVAEKTGGTSDGEKDRRAQLFLPFSRSHSEPVPASEVEISTPTSIWNDSYKCQELPSYRHCSKVRGGSKVFTDMGIIPEQQMSSEKSLGEDAIVEYVKLKKTPVTAASINAVWPHVSQSHRVCTARVGVDRMSGELFESPTVEDKEKEIHLLTNEMTVQRSCSTPATSARKRSRVRSCGKIISETLLRDRAINSGATSSPEDSIRDKYVQSFARREPNFTGGDHDHFIGDAEYTDSISSKSYLRCDHANKEDPPDSLTTLFERNADEVAKNEDALCRPLLRDAGERRQSLADVYETFEFDPTAGIPNAKGDDIRVGTSICNSYGVISLISGKVYGSREVISSLSVTERSQCPNKEAHEKQHFEDAEMSYENVVVERSESPLDESWCCVEHGGTHSTYSTLDGGKNNEPNTIEDTYENVRLRA